MRRIAVIFLVAIFVPSLVLGFLALRTASEQRAILERQASELYQKDADILAGQLAESILGRQREFAERVRVLLSAIEPQRLASRFGTALGEGGTGAAFVIAPDGAVVGAQNASAEDSRFLRENEAFLSSRTSTEVFPARQDSRELHPAPPKANSNAAGKIRRESTRKVQPQAAASTGRSDAESQPPRAVPQISNFQAATSGGTDGVLARFTQNELELILWTRPPEARGYVFGLALPSGIVKTFVREAFAVISPSSGDACFAVLDENARPVALSDPAFKGDWKRPFAAREIGEVLPHWKSAIYLIHPDRLARSARLVTSTLFLLIAIALAAILGGGSLVALDARRQLALAQKKTDFVSNVSHELKTPLTSIRMFAELLEQGRVAEPEKRARYLRIITAESERLTRLINNVLDFARTGKKHDPGRRTEIDLHPVIERAWETQSVHLREAGFACECILENAPYPVLADPDAIGQVLLNLLSNAEKYSSDRREITLRARKQNGDVCISVLDRGIGVPPGEERRIFEAFYRSNDSLAGNVPGTGLGLTLSQRIAKEHGGRIDYQQRDGGGSSFTLRLPLASTEKKT